MERAFQLIYAASSAFIKAQLHCWSDEELAAATAFEAAEQSLRELCVGLDPTPTRFVRLERLRLLAQTCREEMADNREAPLHQRVLFAVDYQFKTGAHDGAAAVVRRFIGDSTRRTDRQKAALEGLLYVLDNRSTVDFGGSLAHLNLGKPYDGYTAARMLMGASRSMWTRGTGLASPTPFREPMAANVVRQVRDMVFYDKDGPDAD